MLLYFVYCMVFMTVFVKTDLALTCLQLPTHPLLTRSMILQELKKLSEIPAVFKQLLARISYEMIAI